MAAYTATLDTPTAEPTPEPGAELVDVDSQHGQDVGQDVRVDQASDRIRQRVEDQQQRAAVREAITAELTAMNGRRYGWTSTAQLARYVAVGDVSDAADHPNDYLGPGALQAHAERLTGAVGEVLALAQTAHEHQAAADAAARVAGEHTARLPDLYRAEADHRQAADQARARASRLTGRLTGRLRPTTGAAAALAAAVDGHARAVQALDQAHQTIQDAHDRAGHHDQQARDLTAQAAAIWRQAAGQDLTHDLRHLPPAQLTERLTTTVEHAGTAAAADTTRRQARLDTVTAELAHRQALPGPVAEAADARRQARRQARQEAAQQQPAPGLGREHDPQHRYDPHRYDPHSSRRGPGHGR